MDLAHHRTCPICREDVFLSECEVHARAEMNLASRKIVEVARQILNEHAMWPLAQAIRPHLARYDLALHWLSDPLMPRMHHTRLVEHDLARAERQHKLWVDYRTIGRLARQGEIGPREAGRAMLDRLDKSDLEALEWTALVDAAWLTENVEWVAGEEMTLESATALVGVECPSEERLSEIFDIPYVRKYATWLIGHYGSKTRRRLRELRKSIWKLTPELLFDERLLVQLAPERKRTRFWLVESVLFRLCIKCRRSSDTLICWQCSATREQRIAARRAKLRYDSTYEVSTRLHRLEPRHLKAYMEHVEARMRAAKQRAGRIVHMSRGKDAVREIDTVILGLGMLHGALGGVLTLDRNPPFERLIWYADRRQR